MFRDMPAVSDHIQPKNFTTGSVSWKCSNSIQITGQHLARDPVLLASVLEALVLSEGKESRAMGFIHLSLGPNSSF